MRREDYSLGIHCSAVGALAFLLQLGTTPTTMVAVVGMTLITPDGKGDVGYQKKITDIVEGKDAEHHIDDGTDGSKAREIKQRIDGRQLVTDIFEGCNTDNDNSPDGGDKHTQMER